MATQRKWMFCALAFALVAFALTVFNWHLYTRYKQEFASCASEKQFKEEVKKRKSDRLDKYQI